MSFITEKRDWCQTFFGEKKLKICDMEANSWNIVCNTRLPRMLKSTLPDIRQRKQRKGFLGER